MTKNSPGSRRITQIDSRLKQNCIAFYLNIEKYMIHFNMLLFFLFPQQYAFVSTLTDSKREKTTPRRTREEGEGIKTTLRYCSTSYVSLTKQTIRGQHTHASDADKIMQRTYYATSQTREGHASSACRPRRRGHPSSSSKK